MRGLGVRRFIVAAVVWLATSASGLASLSFDSMHLDTLDVVIVSGSFESSDLLAPFVALAQRTGANAVTFRSPGGSIMKAMELGRLIRSLRLATIQAARGECESACALAFVGGTVRFAEPGSIGMHRSSFGPENDLAVADAVSAVQQVTAETMIYLGEMGVDPSLLQLSLQYDANDMRYLSRSEMEHYRVVTPMGASVQASPSPAAPAGATAQSRFDLTIPIARSGRVQHPAGYVELRQAADPKSPVIGRIGNGTAVTILETRDAWYRVKGAWATGFAHSSTIAVDQFEGLGFGERTIQVKSVRSFDEARDYIAASSNALVAYLTPSGWFAIATRGTFLNKEVGIAALKQMKARSMIPADSVLTYGNTYVRRVCCE